MNRLIYVAWPFVLGMVALVTGLALLSKASSEYGIDEAIWTCAAALFLCASLLCMSLGSISLLLVNLVDHSRNSEQIETKSGQQPDLPARP